MAYNQEIMPFRLDGKRALVTGGASGIGESVCRVFSDAGASVIVADINKAQAEALATQLPNGSSIECDITDESSVKAAFGGIGRLDILVNNAGIGLVGDVQETELKRFPAALPRQCRRNLPGHQICRTIVDRLARGPSSTSAQWQVWSELRNGLHTALPKALSSR